MIGIFDSGSGGLTVLRAIRDVLPSVDVLYYGDIKHAPYGSRPREELSQLTVASMQYLLQHGATSVVSACNSVSASLALSLFDAFSLSSDQLIEMVGPTVSSFKGSSTRAVLAATPATVNAGLYKDAFAMIGKDLASLSIHDLAGAIERGESGEVITAIVSDACRAIDWSKFDVLILGCTHYPLVESTFRACLPAHVSIFDPALSVAARVEARMWPREAGSGVTKFVITKDSEPFRRFIKELFPGTTYTIEVVE